MGGLTHTDGGTKDSYYGQNYHGIDIGTADVDTDRSLLELMPWGNMDIQKMYH